VFDPTHYFKRIIEFPAIVRRPEDAKLAALSDAGARVLVDERTDYQQLTLVQTPKDELLLLLDGEIQFYSGDEHRFHEALAIVPVLHARRPVRRVGIMGGGDGLAARELLAHYGGEIEAICIIDIDPAITQLARSHPRLVRLNQASLSDPRVEVINADALSYRPSEPFDLILADLPDPTSRVLGRLYNREFYAGLKDQLASPDSLLAVQIVYVSVFPVVREYAVWMYSFVRAGFALCGLEQIERCRDVPGGARHLTPGSLDAAFYFAPDEPRVRVEQVSSDAAQRVDEWYARYLSDYFEERILYY